MQFCLKHNVVIKMQLKDSEKINTTKVSQIKQTLRFKTFI